MTAVDSSVVVAAFASWHEAHQRALSALARKPRLPAHAAIESYSVLTRLPPPNRVPAKLVSEFLKSRFPDPQAVLPRTKYGPLLEFAAKHEITGGAVYDALVAATALVAKATLLTLDERATRTYDLIGVKYELV